jgi:Tn7-like transposition protein D/TniQ protein
MIGMFPEFYPDELVFSACSRYHERMGYRSRESTGRDLFGKAVAKVSVDFPSLLEALIESCPWAQWKSADQLIQQHTLLPFFGPFVPAKRLVQIKADMQGSRGGSIHARLGVLTHNIRDRNLRFCPLCVGHDRANFPETYWHRLHQLPGIDVCPVHKVFLERTSVNPRTRKRSEAFVTAEQTIGNCSARYLDDSNRDHQTLLQLAQDARWLLDQQQLSNDGGNRERYFALLYSRELSAYSGPVKVARLCEQITGHFSEELLQRFNCKVETRYNWVKKLLHESAKSQHPIERLLMIRFLGATAKEFFDLPARRTPFGDGPWPCLNVVSSHFREAVINRYDLTSTNQHKNPKATFKCGCGFAYFRIGPDDSLAARYKATGFETVTTPWLNELRYHVEMSAPLTALADRFHTTVEAIKYVLTNTAKPLDAQQSFHPICPIAPKSEKDWKAVRGRRRKMWLEQLTKNPATSRSVLCKQSPALFTWLNAYDREWIQKHLPPRLKQRGPGIRTDWLEQDKQLAQAVRQQADAMRNALGRPIRISTTCLAARIGKLAVLTKRGHLLPLTRQVLQEVSETIEEYAVRRVQWASEIFQKTGTSPSASELQVRACVSPKIAQHPLVQAAIKANVRLLVTAQFEGRGYERTNHVRKT